MTKKKTPAPRRAGTASKIHNRAAREAALVVGLEKMRTDDPVAFRKLIRLLARLAARSK